MFLARALPTISSYTTRSDRQEELTKMMKNPEKLAKMILRIEFLTACRKAKVSPRFITDALSSVTKIFSNKTAVKSRCDVFMTSLLNESITEAFRTKAYLLRQRNRLSSQIEEFLETQNVISIRQTCSEVFDTTIEENRPSTSTSTRTFPPLQGTKLCYHTTNIECNRTRSGKRSGKICIRKTLARCDSSNDFQKRPPNENTPTSYESYEPDR